MSRIFTLMLIFLGLTSAAFGKQNLWQIVEHADVNPALCDIEEIRAFRHENIHSIIDIECDQEYAHNQVVEGTQCQVTIDTTSDDMKIETVECEYGHWKNTMNDLGHHRQRRGWGFVAFVVACYFLCGGGGGGGGTQVVTKYPPSFESCRSNDIQQQYVVPSGQTSMQISWTPPTAQDKDSKIAPTVEQSGGIRNGGTFGGSTYGKIHYISYRATDSDSLTASCSFSFEVLIPSCPSLSYPSNGARTCPDDNIRGATCTYSCNDGYELSQADGESTCSGGTSPTWTTQPTCDPITCSQPAGIDDGSVICENLNYPYQSVCTFHCNQGYRLGGLLYIKCQADGTWTNHQSYCKDATPPVLSCVSPQIFYADRGTTSTAVFWTVPTATDTVDANPTVLPVNGPAHGAVIAGTSYVTYEAVDDAGNTSPTCQIELRVQQIECQHPLDIVDDPHIRFTCNDHNYAYGTQCTASCILNLPLSGTDLLTCEKNTTSTANSEGYWSWGSGTKPFCELISCPALSAPSHGALVSDTVNLRPVYTMLCQHGYTITSHLVEDGIEVNFNGLFTCTDSGMWLPISYAPPCVTQRRPLMGLQVEILYYTGECGTNETQEEILNIFSEVLANVTKYYQEICPSGQSCSAIEPKIECGDLSGRKKREDLNEDNSFSRTRRNINDVKHHDINEIHHVNKRQAGSYIRLLFTMAALFNPPSGMSYDDALFYYDDVHAQLKNATQDMVDGGSFQMENAPITMTLDADPLTSPAYGDLQCEEGYRLDGFNCKACPAGHYFTNGACARCPVGTFSEAEGAKTCTPCQLGYSTKDIGSNTTTQCIKLCSPGRYSPDGLEDCSLCPVGTYQPEHGQSTWSQCPTTTTTVTAGAITTDQCVYFDVLIGSSQGVVTLYEPVNVISDMSVDFWFKYVTGQPIVKLQISATDGPVLAVTLKATINVDINGNTVELPPVLPSNIWTHVTIVMDAVNNVVGVSVDGAEEFMVYNELPVSVTGQPGTVTLTNTGSAGVYISGLHIGTVALSTAEIQTRASSCHLSPGSDVVNMDVFKILTVPGITVSAPSACDAINDCLPNPCNGHDCLNDAAGYTCICSNDMTGTNCDVPPDYCAGHMCQHNAGCVPGVGNYTCTCSGGYTGHFCDIEPVAGMWSPWSPWSECSRTCGTSTRTRYRSCDSPAPGPSGADCAGDQTQDSDCNMDTCPSCPTLKRRPSTRKICNTDIETGNLVCTMACLDGERFPPGHNGSQEVYTCGPTTGYQWDPKETTLQCVPLIKPRELKIDVTTEYAAGINPSEEVELLTQLESNAAGTPCSNDPDCVMSVTTSNESSRRRRSTATDVTLVFTVPLTDTGDMDIAAYLQNTTVTTSLQEVVDAINSLEATATYIEDNFNSIFDVSLSGVSYSADAGSLQIQAEVNCSAGQTSSDGLCSDCPPGTYISDNYCYSCEIGMYQDMSGQTSCVQCPSGYTTTSIGSLELSQCSVISVTTTAPESPGENEDKGGKKVAFIAIGIAVGALVLSISTIAFIVYIKKRSHPGRVMSQPDLSPAPVAPGDKSDVPRPSSSLSISRAIPIDIDRPFSPPPPYSEKGTNWSDFVMELPKK